MTTDNLLAEAVAHHQAGRLIEASELYRKIIIAEPDNAAAWINLGVALRGTGNAAQAVQALQRGIALVPENPGAHFNLGNSLADLGDDAAACEAFSTATKLAPELADAYVNWGDTLARAGRDNEAIVIFTRGLERSRNHVGLLNNLGNSLLNLHRAPEALGYLEDAARIAPADTAVQRNLANALRLNGQIQPAIKIFDSLIQAQTDDSDSRCLRAFARFSLGQFKQAWPDYHARWKSNAHEDPRPFAQPHWNGQDLNGKTLLVWGEQAVGDELMFATMLPELRSLGGQVIIETEHRLKPLLTRSLPSFKVFARTDPPTPTLLGSGIDFQIAIGDIGQHLRPNLTEFKNGQPYLHADSDQVSKVHRQYRAASGDKLKIGLSWRSGTEHAGTARSLDSPSLARLLKFQDAWWLSLQYGDISDDLTYLHAADSHQPHVDTNIDSMQSMDDLAAQIAGLDMVISVANTTVHLAGALGIPTIALLPHNADWRWMAHGEQCHWYPSVRLMRQGKDGDWSGVLDELEEVLGKANLH
jgi:tetratricopeptide (TPR) repeat protein